MHTPKYREDHSEYLAEDWSRIPLPRNRSLLEEGENTGKKIATLLDPLSDASGLLGDYGDLGKYVGQLGGDLVVGADPNWDANVLHLSKNLRLEGVPRNVWEYTLGGYPVLSKWLSYRKNAVLSTQDAVWVSEIVKRIAALLSEGDQLDVLYERVLEDSE